MLNIHYFSSFIFMLKVLVVVPEYDLVITICSCPLLPHFSSPGQISNTDWSKFSLLFYYGHTSRSINYPFLIYLTCWNFTKYAKDIFEHDRDVIIVHSCLGLYTGTRLYRNTSLVASMSEPVFPLLSIWYSFRYILSEIL